VMIEKPKEVAGALSEFIDGFNYRPGE